MAAPDSKRFGCWGKHGPLGSRGWERDGEDQQGSGTGPPSWSAALPGSVCQPHLVLGVRSCFLFACAMVALPWHLCWHAFPVHLPFQQKCFGVSETGGRRGLPCFFMCVSLTLPLPAKTSFYNLRSVCFCAFCKLPAVAYSCFRGFSLAKKCMVGAAPLELCHSEPKRCLLTKPGL